MVGWGGWRPTLGEWTWCHCWVPLQGAIVVCYGWGEAFFFTLTTQKLFFAIWGLCGSNFFELLVSKNWQKQIFLLIGRPFEHLKWNWENVQNAHVTWRPESSWYLFYFCLIYLASHNHGSGNGYIWKVTTIGGTHFDFPWLWEEV